MGALTAPFTLPLLGDLYLNPDLILPCRRRGERHYRRGLPADRGPRGASAGLQRSERVQPPQREDTT